MLMPLSSPQSRPETQPSDDDFALSAIPLHLRLGRWQVTMSYWSLLSAMVWLFYGALAASLYGTRNAIIALILATIAYSLASVVMTKVGITSGLNTYLLTKPIFGSVGARFTSILIAATTLYYAVFESSTLAVAFQIYFGTGDIRIWYAVILLPMLPLMMGGVQTWMGKLNGFLLPFYFIGLVVAVIATAFQFGGQADWLGFEGVVPPEGRSLPGWALVFVLYMGILINMPNTIDFARFGRQKDTGFHQVISFGWVFYIGLFVLNGLAGIYLVQMVLPNEPASEIGIVQAIITSIGTIGLLFIVISQVRVNSANFFLTTTNLERLWNSVSSFKISRWVWVIGVGVVVFLLMLTNVFSYLDKALTWQGVLIIGWVGVVFAFLALRPRGNRYLITLDEVNAAPRFKAGVIAWLAPSLLGIYLVEAPGVPLLLSQTAQLIVLFLSIMFYIVIHFFTRRNLASSASSKSDSSGSAPAQQPLPVRGNGQELPVE